MTYTVDTLAALDRERQIAADRGLVAALTVGRASVPDASPAPQWPGVAAGIGYLPVVANPELTGVLAELGGVR